MTDTNTDTKVYLARPPPPTIHTSDPFAKLSESEQKLYGEFLEHFSKEVYAVPKVENGELREEEKFWLSRECLLRFLRASKWKLPTAIQRLEDTLKWRREFGIYDVVNADHVEPEAVTGKEIVFGYDVGGRPAFYMIPSRQNTEEPTRQIQFAFWMLERAIDLMEPGVENIALLINFGDKAKHPNMSTARAVLHILQTHYPERLGKALIINIPFIVNVFLKVVMPFVDPVTREKVKFNPLVLEEKYFTPDQIMKESWNGTEEFEYVHEKYWPNFVQLCESRVQTWKENWRKQGGTIGLSEWNYKTGHVAPQSIETPAEKVKEDGEAEEKAVTEEPKVAPPAATIVVENGKANDTPEKKLEEEVKTSDKTAAGPGQHGQETSASHGPGTVVVSSAGDTAGGDGGAGGGDGGE